MGSVRCGDVPLHGTRREGTRSEWVTKLQLRFDGRVRTQQGCRCDDVKEMRLCGFHCHRELRDAYHNQLGQGWDLGLGSGLG